ncbi:FtsW/RodA/SpoVE family cell cycle protein [Erythrobacter sp. HL-111]|uniref:FtsW/RodA/SpoVE family cell cycle protein n=1 Tax=Erythrobacter sp. HL-111 TaxID=1798193 RepID=UPI0006DA0CDD|nr:FtsW/RodA/SpoVE family cell cycle protein [Erythrobacter sp. HL-111]KPP90458.1 MAG: cell division protein FtsW [Erythrobacteraceae bacterium HL-111]SDT13248.1 cell division protein FtsW [Erythrobacter sp. HL-111]
MTGPTALPASRRSAGALPPALVRRGWREEVRIWWREVDRWLLGLILLLMGFGTLAVAAASPASAEQLSTAQTILDPFLFLKRHLLFQLLGLALMIGLSFFARDDARRLGILAFAVMLVLLVLVPFFGVEKNGSRRWLEIGMSLQPSEFLKPGFAVVLAWILSWRLRDPHLPVLAFASALLALIGGLLMLQPNLGETILFAGIWFVMVLLAGVSARRIAGVAVLGLAGLVLTYFLYGNAKNRIDSFFGGGTAYDQVDLAFRTLTNGGWTGTGLWLGTRKNSLPEAHTDYIFSVIGEEFGLAVCALVVALYCGIVLRALMRLVEEEDLFALLAGAGLIAQVGGQALMNVLVNLQLFPSKGATLPLVSYGGSSTLAVCFALGLLLAITRRNPFLRREGGGLRHLFERKEERA